MPVRRTAFASPIRLLPAFLLAVGVACAPSAQASTALRSELAEIAGSLKRLLDGRGESAISVGEFTGPPNYPTSSGPGIVKTLIEELAKRHIVARPRSNLKVKGEFEVTETRPDPAGKHRFLAVRITGLVEDLAGTILPPRSRFDVVGWHRTNDESDAFLVTEYAKSAAATLDHRANLGTITASFAAAWTLVVGGWFGPQDRGPYSIRVYDWPQGRIRTVLAGHDRPVRSLAFSSSGEFLASGDFGGAVRLWQRSPDGFRPIAAVQAHSERVTNVAFDPTGGPLLATSSFDGVVRLFRAGPDGITPVESLRPLNVARIYGLAFHPRGRVLAVAGAAASASDGDPHGEVRFIDFDGRPVGSPLALPSTGAVSLAFAPDGARIAVGCGFPGADTQARVFSFPDGRPLAEFGGHDDTIGKIMFVGDETVASAGGQDYSIRLWDARRGDQQIVLGGKTRNLWSVAFGADGRSVFWGSRLNSPKKLLGVDEYNERGPLDWGLRLDGPELTAAGGSAAVRGTIRSRGRQLELAEGGHAVRLAGGGPVLSSGRPQDVIYALTLMPQADRGSLPARAPALVGGAESLSLYDAADGRRLRELVGHSGIVAAVAPSPRGDFAVSAGGDQTVRLWHLPTGELRLTVFHAEHDWIAWTPQGFYAASPQGDRLIGWHINRGEGRDPEFIAADQFRKKLYQPDVIRRVLDVDAVGEAPPAVTEILPPRVRVTQPVADAASRTVQATTPQLEVAAVAESASGHPVVPPALAEGNQVRLAHPALEH